MAHLIGEINNYQMSQPYREMLEVGITLNAVIVAIDVIALIIMIYIAFKVI